jgi:hypothetical protein
VSHGGAESSAGRAAIRAASSRTTVMTVRTIGVTQVHSAADTRIHTAAPANATSRSMSRRRGLMVLAAPFHTTRRANTIDSKWM